MYVPQIFGLSEPHMFLRLVAQFLNLSGCTSLRTLRFRHALYQGYQRPERLSSIFNAVIGAITSTSRIPFKLYHHLEFNHIPADAQCTDFLSVLEWENLERAMATHPCRANQITFVCEAASNFLGLGDVEGFVGEKLPDLNSNKLLDIVRQIQVMDVDPE